MDENLEFSAAFIERRPEAAARALRGLAPDNAAALLRLLDAERRDSLLAEMPELARRQVANSLGYPPDSVGALMSRSIVALDGAEKVADALTALREYGPDGVDSVFVTDSEHRVTGMIALSRLLCSKANTVLQRLGEGPPPLLASRSSVDAVVDHEAWFVFDVLPVVNRDRQLIGALTHASLRRWLRQPGPTTRQPSASILLSMSEDLVGSVSGLCGLMLDAPPASGNTRARRR